MTFEFNYLFEKKLEDSILKAIQTKNQRIDQFRRLRD